MLIIGNWKAYVENREEAKKIYGAAKRIAARTRGIKLVLAPPAPFLGLLAAGKRTKIAFAGQDISASVTGSATGEVVGSALFSAGASYVIIGHSERRARGESDTLIAEKVKRAVVHRLIPVLCIGEKERDEDARYLLEIRRQLDAVYTKLSSRERLEIVIAYEPVWAIGQRSQDAMHAEDLIEMMLYIRKVLGEYVPGKASQKTTILYGGSVDAENVRTLAKGSRVDGFLVGRASAEPETFSALVRALA
ncbi:MAG: triose-phosphate isomerase [Minisyncoccia bacterium]